MNPYQSPKTESKTKVPWLDSRANRFLVLGLCLMTALATLWSYRMLVAPANPDLQFDVDPEIAEAMEGGGVVN